MTTEPKINPDTLRIEDMLQTIAYIEEIAATGRRERTESFAIAYSIAVIGEAASKVSADLRKKYPDISWQEIISTRHKIIHEYGKLNTRILWEVVDSHLQILKNQLTELFEREKF